MEKLWNGNKKIFSGYFRGTAKRAAEKIKDVPGHSFEEVCKEKSFGAKLQSDVVDISFDDKEMSQRFLDIADSQDWRCLALENPSSGHIHTYWKDTDGRIKRSGKDIKMACGLIADIHKGSTYIPLRINNIDRFPPVYDINEGEEYQNVPDELLPVKTDVQLWKSAGRNDDSYRYILILQTQLLFERDRIREMYRNVINPFIFSEPLDDSELDVILRDESFEKTDIGSFFVGSVFKFDAFAEYLKTKYHMLVINDQVHIYEDGVYRCRNRLIEKCMVHEIPKLKDAQRKEVMKYLNLICDQASPSDERYIAFENGVYDLVDGELYPLSPEFIVTNKIPWNYNQDAYDALCDKTLNKIACGDPQIRALLEECAGSCFYRSNTVGGGKAFILTGDKANGKSTYLDMVKALLSERNIASLDLSEIGGERFSTAMLFGKLANIGDDISDNFLQGKEVAIFKKIVTGNRIKAEDKGADPFEFNPYCKLLFSANDIPRMRDKTGAVLRRLVIIPFNATFSKYLPDGSVDPEYDPEIKKKLISRASMEYLAALGVAALKRVLDQKEFTNSTKADAQLSEYEEENNPIVAFINEQGDMIENQPTGDVYRRYTIFCQENSMQAMSHIVFSKQISKRTGLIVKQKKINGKNFRIFMKDGAGV